MIGSGAEPILFERIHRAKICDTTRPTYGSPFKPVGLRTFEGIYRAMSVRLVKNAEAMGMR